MIPLSDENRTRRTPVVSYALLGAIVLAFLWQLQAGDAAVYAFGLIPARLVHGALLPPQLEWAPAWATVFTSMFLHGGWMHLGGNLLYLWIFGDNVEDALGRGASSPSTFSAGWRRRWCRRFPRRRPSFR